MNDDREKLVDMFNSTHLGDCLRELSLIYDDVEKETSAFCEDYNIHCTAGCGECCEHFMPDITPAEAKLVASYLLLLRKDISLIDKVQQPGQDHCPLYDESNPYHCQVYSVRPLVCRLFAQCASRGKDLKAVFRRCRFSGGALMPERLEFPVESDIKTMDDYGLRVHSLESGEVKDLDEAVTNALGEVSMIAGFLGLKRHNSNDDGDDSTPTPSPQAS
ncbi:MAG: YkgJ family cysteine cluster protein [Sphaerochaetaceae bacterium]|nr:YkgJ family cysteine cluster protein [Sphaerochaetaceae bacterium]